MRDDKAWDPSPTPTGLPAQAVTAMPVYIPNADRLLIAKIDQLYGELAKFVAAVGRLRGYLEAQEYDGDTDGQFVKIDPDHVLDMFVGLVPGLEASSPIPIDGNPRPAG